MIEGLPQYQSVVDSHQRWLGDVPSHWDVLPALAAYRPNETKNTGMIEDTVLSLSYGRIIIKPKEKLHGLVPESFETYQVVEPGDIIVRTTDLQNDRTSLRIGQVKDRGIITSAYTCLRTTDRLNPEYGYQFLNAFDLTKAIYGYGSGLRQSLGFRHIKRMPVLIPPLDEQAAIVKFLGHANRKIGRYIQAKRKLIKLLEEQKQVIIHRAVTRGLDPNVRMKPSGVDWLGDVPEHWDVIPCRYLFRPVTRTERIGTEIKLSVTQKNGLIPTESMTESSTQAVNYDRFQVCIPGDLVLNKYKAHLGVFWAATQRGLITPNYTVFRTTGVLSTEYFQELFHTRMYRDIFKVTVYGVTEGMSPLYTKDFLRIPALAPPPEEQRKIVAFVRAKTADEDRVIRKVDDEIGLLKEYQVRLTADLVTGKLDVREAASRLPDLMPGDELNEQDVDLDDEGTEEGDL